MLTNKFRTRFADAVRSRGKKYYENGQIEEEVVQPWTLLAVAFGTEAYNVLILKDPFYNLIWVYCGCPHFDGGDNCKHLWGAMLLAEELGIVSRIIDQGNRLGPLTRSMFEELHDWIPQNLVESMSRRDHERLLAHGDPIYWPDADDPDDDSPEQKENSPNNEGPVPSATPWSASTPVKPEPPKSASRQVEKDWRSLLREFRNDVHPVAPGRIHGVGGKELVYVLRHGCGSDSEGLRIDLALRERLKGGEFGAVKSWPIQNRMIPDFESPLDRRLLSHFASDVQSSTHFRYNPWKEIRSGRLSHEIVPIWLQEIARSGRLMYADSMDLESVILTYEEKEWSVELIVESSAKKPRPGAVPKNVRLSVNLFCDDAWLEIEEISETIRSGYLISENRVLSIEPPHHTALIELFSNGPIVLPTAELPDFLGHLSRFGPLPSLRRNYMEDPNGGTIELVRPTPQLSLKISRDKARADLEFLYDGLGVPPSDPARSLFDETTGRIFDRDLEAEQEFTADLRSVGFSLPAGNVVSADAWEIDPKRVAKGAAELIDRQWKVLAQGKLSRSNGTVSMKVSSGIDWFDLDGDVRFGDAGTSLGRLLAALGRGERLLLLDDGTYGMVPDEWLEKFSPLKGFFDRDTESVRFGSNQTILIDMLLAGMPDVEFDEVMAAARERLRSFKGVRPLSPPKSFQGKLRPYQETALGWFQFLREFGFGGCLADDMGLGKTVQALALLEERRQVMTVKKNESIEPLPSLAVLPKSLIFNWQREAGIFAPELKVLDYTGVGRKKYRERFDEFDLIVTTYGTMRKDVQILSEIEFDYVILDESQAIKNAGSNTSKAARLLQGRHRLAMSGTPVENRIEELWSLFEFLNPGMLGSAKLFGKLAEEGEDAAEARSRLAASLRPFILRRTKSEVAPELPAKTEQTLYCDLSKKERDFYDRLRAHIRAEVLGVVDSVGLKNSSIKVLEGLLRLRQAACHPGLVDKGMSGLDSTKFELLLPMVEELQSEGHKALIFSQFTSYLALLKKELDARKIRYEYLDGKTRDRAEKVDTFQNDETIPLFLISLKAGGVGLNLTSAEYVFLLDPWWNPAVEAQAIDRTHRIGQTRPVFAHRIIARDTIEEKVLELQKKKRELADSLISGENSLIRNLTREDLDGLLS